MSNTSTFLRRAFGGVALVLLLLAPSAHAAFGEAQPFNLAGAGPSHPAAVAGSDDGTIVSVWAADPGLSWFTERPPAVQVAFQRSDGHRATFGVGRLAAGTWVGLVMDRGGKATVVWQTGATDGLFVARCTSRGCASARRVGTRRLGWLPALAVDASDRVLIVWPGRTKRGEPTLLHRMVERGRLGAVGAVGESGKEPVVAAAAHRFVIGWKTTRGIRTTVVERAGRSTAPRTAIAGSMIEAFRLTGGAAGILAAWRPSAGGPQLALADVDARGRVGRADVMAAGYNASFDVALGSTGRAAIAWCSDRSGATVTAALRERGGQLGAPVSLMPAGGCGRPAVAVDGAGRATVVSVRASGTEDTATSAPYAATAGPGLAFGSPFNLDPSACTRSACGWWRPYIPSVDVVAVGRSTTAVWISAQEGYAAHMDG
ncbi:hypothetical protein LRS13_24090 [Svornostia abyssi]|uniref:Uncharacterized protein n=1 Tax=Svornostia abyssi TaxID=2898438 RepID=A0ABY5PGK4_9ACTN|nr:hypothetical protein LRS13_24090 [Parviterribacteraceae bacterium J379]